MANPCYRRHGTAKSARGGSGMIAALLLMTVLAFGSVVLWVTWWLVADMFNGSAPSTSTSIRTATLTARPPDSSDHRKRRPAA